MDKRLLQSRPLMATFFLLACLFSIAIFLKNAWVAEDAFIILRSLDQFLAGNGFRWNPHERVQVFTSPLWYLLLVSSTAFCQTLYLNLIGLSLLLHVAMLIVLGRLSGSSWRGGAAVMLLTLSQGFFDYTSSGLEYPLIYCLMAAFVLLFLRNDHLVDRYALAAIAGLALVTRHDLLFLLLPMILHLAGLYRQQLDRRSIVQLVILFLGPLALWTLFSLVYYGFPFPNTAYAKLGIGEISRWQRLERGWIYLLTSLKTDPVTPLLIGMAVWQGFRQGRLLQTVAISLVLAFGYITWIGADYMLGRFYAPLYLVAVLSLCRMAEPWQPRHLPSALLSSAVLGWLVYQVLLSNLVAVGTVLASLQITITRAEPVIAAIIGLVALCALFCIFSGRARTTTSLVLGLLLFTSTQQHDSPWQTGYRDWGKVTDFDMWWNLNNVSRERYFIYHWTSLDAWQHRDQSRAFPDHPWCHEGLATADVEVIPFAGMTGYCMGIHRIGVDIKAITDPLLARMPKTPEGIWASGGVNRVIPDGYLESLRTGTNQIQNPDLARYYGKLHLITQAEPLLSGERLATIVAFNLGLYDHWLTSYRYRLHANE